VSSGVLTVFHTSDFQCGSPFRPHAADAMIRLADEIRPDVIVSSGDLTQRAKVREFATARSVLDRFGDVPKVVTPGNHDVPLYRVWERLTDPYRNWRRFAGPDLNSAAEVPGATFVALNSSAPHRALVNGRIGDEQVAFARRTFAAAAPGDLRILVIHHHFIAVPDGKGGRPLPGASRLAREFESMGVDAVLGGHVHQIHVRRSGVLTSADASTGVPLVASGTTTSRRGRGVEAHRNSLHVIRFEQDVMRVTPYLLDAGAQDFEKAEEFRFARRKGHDAGDSSRRERAS